MKRLLISIIVFCVFHGIIHGEAEIKKIIILSLFNSGSIEYDRFCESIPTYLYTQLESLSGTDVIPPSKVKMYMQEMGYRKASLEEEKTLVSLAERYDAHYIIDGFFKVQEKHLFLSYTIRQPQTGNVVIVKKDISYVKMEDTDTATLENALEPVIAFFSSMKIKSALLTVKTDNTCQLCIDNELLCRTPQHVWLPEGEHRIQIYYKDNILIYDKTITMRADKNTEIDIPVFLSVNLTAGRECAVFINDIFKGMTPFKTTVFSGTEYHIRIVYKDENADEIAVADFMLPDSCYRDIELDFPDTGTIEAAGTAPFLVSLNSEEPHTLPHNYSLLEPGEYNLKILVKDDVWNKKWIFSDEIHILEPFAAITVDSGSFVFEKAFWKCFLPSAAQFHNKQKMKGGLIAGLFSATLLTSGISYLVGETAYNDYNRINTAITENGLESGYTTRDLQEKYNIQSKATLIFNIALWSSAALYLYSGIDGWITMDHINNLFRTQGDL